MSQHGPENHSHQTDPALTFAGFDPNSELTPAQHFAAMAMTYQMVGQHNFMTAQTTAAERDQAIRERDEAQLQATEWMDHATKDSLTGLPNRLAMLRRLDQLIDEQPGRFALAFVDLDGLKRVNDTAGHEAGNQLIRTAATIMADSVRTHDESGFPAREHDTEGRAAVRLSGDEFVLIIDNIDDSEQLTAVLNRVQSNLAEGGVQASFGEAIHEPGQDALTLLETVDEKMYENKTERRQLRQLQELAALPVAVRERLYEMVAELDEMKIGVAGLNNYFGKSSR